MLPDGRNLFPVMCLTQDGIGMSHVEQVTRLCAAGARWIQLRMKGSAAREWLSVARASVTISHSHGATLIVNDSVDIALESGADGVHLGSQDSGWREARRRMGTRPILGGTVNNSADAARAIAAGCLDYAGVGPLRFTATKQNLAPVLGLEGVRAIIRELQGLPAWVIGGVESRDLPGLREAGAAGAAVASALYRGGTIEDNLRDFLNAWASSSERIPAPAGQP
jgi:thiamine-phosphate pyrophosphorylase